MTHIRPPEVPGWYADVQGAWWWWDGAAWTPAPGAAATTSPRQQERTQALVLWILYLIGGGWIAALVFYLISKEKPFVRHHAAEALNLFLVLLVPQIVATALLVPGYLDFLRASFDDPEGASLSFSGLFLGGIAISGVVSLISYGLGIAAAIKANRGEWWRLPIGVHPVRGVLPKDEVPPYDVG